LVFGLTSDDYCRQFPPPVKSLHSSSIKRNSLRREKLLGFSDPDRLPTKKEKENEKYVC